MVVVVACGITAAAVQVAVGSPNKDLQWSGARLLLEGRDPYQVALHGHLSAFVKSQYPNYAPLLYVLLLPLGAVSLASAQLVWVVLNLAMLLAAAALVAQAAGLRGRRAATFVALFFCSAPVALTIGSGQQGALALFAAVLAVRARREWTAGSALALMLVKYSFAPVAFAHLMRRRWTALGAAAAIEVVGLALFCLISGSGVASTAAAPLHVARLTQAPGAGDVLTLARLAGCPEPVAFTAAAAACLLMAWFGRRVLRAADWLDGLAVGALISLVALPHLSYDYCFLLPVAGSAVRLPRWPRAILLGVVGLLCYNWLFADLHLSALMVHGVLRSLPLLLLAFVVLVRALRRHGGAAAVDGRSAGRARPARPAALLTPGQGAGTSNVVSAVSPGPTSAASRAG